MKQDGRRARGDRTRRAVALLAARLASVEGLSAVSLGRLSDGLGVSKSGIATLYGTKEDIQLAAVDVAREVFVAHVVSPALEAPPGLPRLRALADAWLRYVEGRVFPGGCFMVATAAEFDSRPGPVRDALAQARSDWLALLAREVAQAQADGELPGLTPESAAFEIDAVLAAANIALNFGGAPDPVATARTVLSARFGAIGRK